MKPKNLQTRHGFPQKTKISNHGAPGFGTAQTVDAGREFFMHEGHMTSSKFNEVCS